MFGFFKPGKSEPQPIDFATIKSREKAEALHRAGVLQKLSLLPPEFGGDDRPANTIFVPPGVAKRKADIDQQIIGALIKARKISKYSAKPEYEAGSVVPISLTITVSDPETYEFPITIWGSAIDRQNKVWDQVYATREAAYLEHFGAVDGDVQKLMNLTGVWPGGCLVQIHAARHQLWVSSSFGLTNADMPAETRIERFAVERIHRDW
jgi:hypothetical protein